MATVVDGDSLESFDDLRSALDASGVVGTWDWDMVLRCARYDRGAANLLALDPERAGRSLHAEEAMIGIHPDDRVWLFEAVKRSRAGRGLFVAEYRVVSPDRGIRWILSRGRVYYDQRGRPVRSKGVLIDITESREESGGFFAEADTEARTPLDRAAASLLDARKALDEAAGEASNHLRLILDLALFEVGAHLARRARH